MQHDHVYMVRKLTKLYARIACLLIYLGAITGNTTYLLNNFMIQEAVRKQEGF